MSNLSLRIAEAALDDDLLEEWCTVVRHGGRQVDAILREDVANWLRAVFEKADPS